MGGQVILLSVPVGVGKPLSKAAAPSLESPFVREMGIVLRPMDRTAALPRVPSFRDHILPYELRAVETALSAAVQSWEAETAALEHRILPTLRALLQKVWHAQHRRACPLMCRAHLQIAHGACLKLSLKGASSFVQTRRRMRVVTAACCPALAVQMSREELSKLRHCKATSRKMLGRLNAFKRVSTSMCMCCSSAWCVRA